MRKLFLLLLVPSVLHAQSDLQAHWTTYRNTHITEKVFVHTDKDYYFSGELCWFKCYDVSATNLRPLDLSKVAYVEVLDVANKPVLQAKVALKGGSGSGSFYLPFTLESGTYQLRAYTNWMKNQPAEYFFQKSLTILNPRAVDTLPAPPAPRATFSLFPEGGNLVDGLTSTVAFMALDGFGQPLSSTGIVIDDHGDTLASFSGTFGRFAITPFTGRSYTAHVHFADGEAAAVALPSPYAQGYVMHLDSTYAVSVHTNGTSDHSVYLLVHNNADVEVTLSQPLSDGHATFPLPVDHLAEGVSVLTVFNEARQPVCERLFYKAPTRPSSITVTPDRSSYDTRSPVSLAVALPAGLTHADLSISVYRLDSLQSFDPNNICSYFWLNSDLGGYIPQGVSVDDLLLTRGWRRFRWEDVLLDKTPLFTYAAEYNGHLITGKIVDTRTGDPVPNVEGFVSAPGTRADFASAISDREGRVAFDLPHMYGSKEIVAQTNSTNHDSLYRVDINSPFSDVYPSWPETPFILPLRNPKTVLEHNLSMQVQNAYGAMKAQGLVFPPSVDTAFFYNKPDLSYLLDNYVRFTTMEEVLREYVQLLNVQRHGEHFHLWAYNDPGKVPFDDDPLVLLDGVPYFNIDLFMKCDPLKVWKIDVITRRYMLGGSYFDGILNCISYKGDLAGLPIDPHATALDYEGLQERRVFYSPSYVDGAHRASRLPDFRDVLYWDPSLSGGPVRFYSSDLPGRYAVVVQGVSSEGGPVYGHSEFEVR